MMSMEVNLLKPAALTAVAILASACTLAKSGAGSNPTDTPNDGPRAATSPVHTDRKPDSELNALDERIDNKATQREVEAQGPAEHPDTAPPGARAEPERPWARNTGPSDPGALTPSGSRTVTTDGAVLENLDITGMVTIDADNVTLRNFRIHGSTSYGIRIVNGHSGIAIEDGEIYDISTGILGVGYTGRRLHIHDVQNDATKAQGTGGPTLVEYSFFEKLGMKEGAHADGNQTIGGSNITFRYNNIWMPAKGPNYPGPPYKSNAAFMNSSTISNFVIEYNWLNGGNYTIYCGKGGGPGVSVRNNKFGRDYRYGVVTDNCDEWTGNTWEDTGDPI